MINIGYYLYEMEPDNLPIENTTSKVCANCGSPVIKRKDFPHPYAKKCRTTFIKFPIPGKIKIFGAAILVIFLLTMIKMPANLSTAVHFKRGKNAAEKKLYHTAQKEFLIVKQKKPGYSKINEYLVLASFYNQDLKLFGEYVSTLENKQSENEEIYNELNQIIKSASGYITSDSLNALLKIYGSEDSIPAHI